MAWSAFKEWRRRFVRSFKNGFKLYWESWLGRIGLGIVIFFVIIAIFAPWIAPYSPEFKAPDEDIFLPYEYPLTHKVSGKFNVSIYCTTPGKLDVKGISWVIIHTPNKITMYAVTDPIEGRKGIYAEENTTTNQSSIKNKTYAEISPWESVWWFEPTVIEIDAAKLGLQTPLSEPVYYPGCLNPDYTLPEGADPDLNGLLVFAAGDELIFYDVANHKIILRKDIGFIPTYVVGDTLGTGKSSKPPTFSQQTSMTGERILITPRRFLVCASENKLAAFRIFYSYSVINQTTDIWVEKFIDDTENYKFTTKPIIFYNPYIDWKNAIIVGLNNASTLFYRFDEELTLDKTNYTLLPPVKFYENYELVTTPGTTKIVDVWPPPRYYLPVKMNNELYLIIYNVANEEEDAKIKLGDYSSAIQPEIIAYSKGEIAYISVSNAKENKLLRCEYYKEEESTGEVLWKFEITKSLDLPEKAKNIFVAGHGTEYSTGQIFVLTENKKIYTTNLNLDSLSPFYTVVYGVKRLEKVEDAENIIYMGSLKGSIYSTEIGKAEAFGLYYNTEKGKVIIYLVKGVNVAPLPPGTYPSGNTYWFGTDHEGHDILTYLIYGSRIALLIGISAAFTSTILGTLIGIIAGYYGGWVDTILMRIVDVMLTLPSLPIILIMTSVLGPNVINIVLVLAFLGWAGIARVIRAQTLSLKARPFVDAARVAGASNARIIIKHIMPNVLPFTFLYMTIGVSGAILSEAALSFLGLGDPKSITWGQMLSTLQSTGNTMHAWWWLLPPGLCITLISLGFYLIGRAFDEIVNPRLRKR